MKREQSKIKIGNVELDADEFATVNQKHRVTTFIDGDILHWLKSEAAQKNIGYQTLLNLKLRELMEAPMMIEQIKTMMEKVLSERLDIPEDRIRPEKKRKRAY